MPYTRLAGQLTADVRAALAAMEREPAKLKAALEDKHTREELRGLVADLRSLTEVIAAE